LDPPEQVSKGGGHPGRARGFNSVKSLIASVKTSPPRGRDPEEIVMASVQAERTLEGSRGHRWSYLTGRRRQRRRWRL